MRERQMDKVRILLLDDHALFREGLSRLLEREPDLEMAAHCGTVGEAMDILSQKPIDLILLDYDLGNERGLEFVARARNLGFKGRLLLVTAGISDAESVEALRLGAGGIFMKHSPPLVLTQAIRKVMAGETWLDENAIQSLIRMSRHPKEADQARPFTERESQVLRGIAEGLSNKEIGARLTISETSVKAAVQKLFQKTGVRTRGQLVRIALERQSAGLS